MLTSVLQNIRGFSPTHPLTQTAQHKFNQTFHLEITIPMADSSEGPACSKGRQGVELCIIFFSSLATIRIHYHLRAIYQAV